MAESITAARSRAARLTSAVVLVALACVFLVLGMPRADAENGDPATTSASESSGTAGATPSDTSTDPAEGTPTSSTTPTATESEQPTDTSSPTTTATGTPTGTPTTGTTDCACTSGPVEVDGASLYWAMNDEATNKAHAPRTFNFFSAGVLSNKRTPENTITQAQWRATAGNVTIQKLSKGRWRTATWADLTTDERGAPLTSATSGRFNHTQMAFANGVGTLDVAGGDARIRWTGTATVIGYSGMNSFRLIDPELVVTDGTGTLQATLSGYGTDREGGTAWVEFPPQKVTLATLENVRLDKASFTATPAYAGVRAPSGLEAKQMTTESGWGAFPASFLTYQEKLGIAPFWYSSGGITDSFKTAKPLTVTLPGAEQPTPSVGPTQAPTSGDEDDEIPPPTVLTPPPAVTGPLQPVAPAPTAVGVEQPAAVVPPQLTVQAASGQLPHAAALTSDDLVSTAASAAPVAAVATTWWWSAAGLLLLAAALLAVPLPRAPARS